MRRKTLAADVARGLGISKQRVSQLAKRGMPVSSIEAAREWRREHQDLSAPEPEPTSDAAAQMHAERLRWIAARRQMAETDLAERRRKLLPADEVRAFWIKQILAMRAHFLALPAKVAPLVAATPADVPRVCDLIEKEIHRGLQELADGEVMAK